MLNIAGDYIAHGIRVRASGIATLQLERQIAPNVWHLNDDTEPILRAMGERGDIIKSMCRALEANDLEGQLAAAYLVCPDRRP